MITRFDPFKVGVALIFVSALCFASMGIFIKALDETAWDLIFWRSAFTLIYLGMIIASRKRMQQEFTQMGRGGVISAVVFAAATAAFVPAFKLTTVANVTLIYTSAPVVAGVFAWALIGEKVNRLTAIGIALTLIGVGVIFWDGYGGGGLRGDLLALMMTIGVAMGTVVYRIYPDTPAMGPVVLSCILLIITSMMFTNPLAIERSSVPYLLCFGVLFTIASVTYLEGVKRVSAAQATLFSLSETPLAPLLAFLILSEVPSGAAIIGGCLIICAILLPLLGQSKTDAF